METEIDINETENKDHRSIRLSSFKKLKCIGEGASGKIFLVQQDGTRIDGLIKTSKNVRDEDFI
jgi:hypothetical protein